MARATSGASPNRCTSWPACATTVVSTTRPSHQESIALSRATAATWRRRRTHYEECLAVVRELGDTGTVALALNNLARVERDQGRWAETACASLALFQALGDRQGIAWVLSNLTVVAQRHDAWDWAAKLHGAADALREAVGSAALSLSPSERLTYAAAVAAARAALGGDRFGAAAASGRATPPDALAGARAGSAHRAGRRQRRPGAPATAPAARRLRSAPRREREVAALVAGGHRPWRKIAEQLVITEGTVGVHLSNIFNSWTSTRGRNSPSGPPNTGCWLPSSSERAPAPP
ncbi:MAG: LuxR C-terminal-related transcriptional regulator [Dehalococcoidia bacterium]